MDGTCGSRLHASLEKRGDDDPWGNMPCRSFGRGLPWRGVIILLVAKIRGEHLLSGRTVEKRGKPIENKRFGIFRRTSVSGHAVWGNIPPFNIVPWVGEGEGDFETKALRLLCSVREDRMSTISEAYAAQLVVPVQATDWGFLAVSHLRTMDLRGRRDRQCYFCPCRQPFFKMFRSMRDYHISWAESQWENHEGPVLMCINCELDERRAEMARWDKQGISYEDSYGTMAEVKKDIKRKSKGDQWMKQAQMMKQAEDAVVESKSRAQVRLNQMFMSPGVLDGSGVSSADRDEFVKKGAAQVSIELKSKMDNALMKRARTSLDPEVAVMEVTQLMKDASLSRKFFMTSMNVLMTNLVKTLISMLFNEMDTKKSKTPMIELLQETGGDMVRVAKKKEEYDRSLEEDLGDASDLEEELIEDMDWQIDGVPENRVIEYVKAADYEDEFCPGMRVYNVCTCVDEMTGKKCGYAFPGKFWLRTGQVSRLGYDQMLVGKKFGWKCRCEWENVKEAADEQGPESQAHAWWEELVQTFHGLDRRDWPGVGCGKGFKAFSGGASLIFEIEVKHGDGTSTWEAFNSERLPWLLESKLKENCVRKAFTLASHRLEPAEVLRMLPSRFPMTHVALGRHPVTGVEMEFKGIAKYPLSEWEAKGRPTMTQKDWCEFVMRISQFDLTSLRPLYDTARYTLDQPDAGKLPKWMTREW